VLFQQAGVACGVECILKVKVHPNELGVLFHGLSEEPAFFLDNQLDRAGTSEPTLEILQHSIFSSLVFEVC